MRATVPGGLTVPCPSKEEKQWVARKKVLVEIFEADPFGGCCGPRMTSDSAIREFRDLLVQREAIINSLSKEFDEAIRVERTILSSRRRADSYPEHVQPYLGKKVKPPLVFIDRRLVWHGTFPSLEQFKALVRVALRPNCSDRHDAAAP